MTELEVINVADVDWYVVSLPRVNFTITRSDWPLHGEEVLPEELVKWLDQQTYGKTTQPTYIHESEWFWEQTANLVKFHFRNKQVAILFKLAWGGENDAKGI
jgi:hypothetical protein